MFFYLDLLGLIGLLDYLKRVFVMAFLLAKTANILGSCRIGI